jgi:hypothetical protein
MHYRLAARAVLTGAILALMPVFGWKGATASGQAPVQVPGKIYTSKTVFKLPIKIDDRLRTDLKEVCLYVKDGAGEWERKDSVPPTQGEFQFRVPHDGEYWFSVVTVDKNGRMTPADVSRERPGLMVVVDTHKDAANAAVPPAPGPAAPPAPPTGPVLPAAVPPSVVPSLPPAQAVAPPAPQVTVPTPAPVAVAPQAPVTQAVSAPPAPAPAPQVQPSPFPPQPMAYNPVAGTRPDGGNYAMPKVAMGTGAMPHSHHQLINSPRASIDYRIDQVGPSGIGKVDIWLTADDGHTWQRYGEDSDHRSPAEINLPGEGVFGVRLVVTNGNGFGGRAPVAGDPPHNVIEVDLTKPFVQLREIEPVGPSGTVDIRWTASDKNLGAEPVNLYYAPGREGPWLPVATSLKNEGLYRWSFPRNGISQFFVRLEVTDLAGNVNRCETQAPVVLDTTEPQVQVLGVSGVGSHGLSPSGN